MWNEKKYIAVFGLLLFSYVAFAQKAERDYVRRGNRQYRDSSYVDAEINYRKALEANPTSTTAMFNLGNAMLYQQKSKEALEQYATIAKVEKNKETLAKDLHNVGVIWHTQKDYDKAIAAYKEALRNNPHDDETRYNLALAMKMKKDQQGQNENQQEQQQEKQQQEQDQQRQQNQQQQQDKMSKENAEQLLRSVMQDEKSVQDKVKKQQQIRGNKLEKDW